MGIEANSCSGGMTGADVYTQKAQTTVGDQKEGTKGVIRQLSGDTHVVSRLRELGFIPGYQVRLKKRVPFGGPLVVEVNGTSVALRQEEAQCIQL